MTLNKNEEETDAKEANVEFSELNMEAVASGTTHLFYSQKWLKLLEKEYHFTFCKAKSLTSDAHLILADVRKLGIRKWVSLPFSDYTIPYAANPGELQALFNQLRPALENRALEITYRLPDQFAATNGNGNDTDTDTEEENAHNQSAWCHVVDTLDKVEIENNMHNSFSRGTRQAHENELRAVITTSYAAVERFYTIYHSLRLNKFGKLPQPVTFFRNLWEIFIRRPSGTGFVLEVLKEDKTIASSIILSCAQTLYYKFGCSTKEDLNLRPNNLLFHTLFEYASEHGYTEVDLGLSGLGDSYKGLRRFKRHMGGRVVPIYTYTFEPKDYDKEAEKDLNALTGSLTRQVVDLNPDPSVTDKFSSLLYPYFA